MSRAPSREPRILRSRNEIEYWLLELALDSYTPLSFLTTTNCSGLFNVRFEAFEPNELLSSFERLLHAREIEVLEEKNHRSLAPTREALKAMLHRPLPPPRFRTGNGPVYGLTAQGGAHWESLTQADWQRYNPLIYFGSLGAMYGEICAMDRGRAEAFLAGVRAYDSARIQEGSETWEVLTPWEATYWKSIARGHRVTFRLQSGVGESYRPRPRWFLDFQEWFRRPFGPQ